MTFVRNVKPNDLFLLEDGTSIQNKTCITVKFVRLSKEETEKLTQSKNGNKENESKQK